MPLLAFASKFLRLPLYKMMDITPLKMNNLKRFFN